MKKLLAVFAALNVVAISSTSVIACRPGQATTISLTNAVKHMASIKLVMNDKFPQLQSGWNTETNLINLFTKNSKLKYTFKQQMKTIPAFQYVNTTLLTTTLTKKTGDITYNVKFQLGDKTIEKELPIKIIIINESNLSGGEIVFTVSDEKEDSQNYWVNTLKTNGKNTVNSNAIFSNYTAVDGTSLFSISDNSQYDLATINESKQQDYIVTLKNNAQKYFKIKVITNIKITLPDNVPSELTVDATKDDDNQIKNQQIAAALDKYIFGSVEFINNQIGSSIKIENDTITISNDKDSIFTNTKTIKIKWSN